MKTLTFLSILFYTCLTLANPCLERHGALDIGSGSTKAYAAVVDVCKKRILETLIDEKIAVPFKEAVEKTGENFIPDPFLKEGGDRISGLVIRMKALQLKNISAIATSVFRTAKNGLEASQALSKQIQIPVQIITQEQEAEIGAQSALSQLMPSQAKSASVIVWDIGGGSMQMWSQGRKQTHIYQGDLASVSFKNQIIREILKKDPQTTSSPNPIGAGYLKALQISEKHAKSNVPSYFQSQPMARWLGIGGVLALSVQNQVQPGQKEFSRSALEKTVKQKAGMKDSELTGDYRSTEISNLILVLGYMKTLKMKKIETFDTSLAQGWIFDQIQK